MPAVLHTAAGTSACPNGHFFCANKFYLPLLLNASMVDDGVCGAHHPFCTSAPAVQLVLPPGPSYPRLNWKTSSCFIPLFDGYVDRSVNLRYHGVLQTAATARTSLLDAAPTTATRRATSR